MYLLPRKLRSTWKQAEKEYKTTHSKYGNKKRGKRKRIVIKNKNASISYSGNNCVLVTGDIKNAVISRSKDTSVKKRKTSRVKALLAKLIEKRELKETVKFVVDCDNVGHISSILDFFSDFDVSIHFFVKNQMQLQVPAQNDYQITFQVSVILDEDDDDDVVALNYAVNEDAFILSKDGFKEYISSGLISQEWIDSHRVPCSYTTKLLDGRMVTVALPSIQKSYLPRR